jgi:hypothetical protein
LLQTRHSFAHLLPREFAMVFLHSLALAAYLCDECMREIGGAFLSRSSLAKQSSCEQRRNAQSCVFCATSCSEECLTDVSTAIWAFNVGAETYERSGHKSAANRGGSPPVQSAHERLAPRVRFPQI